MILKNSVALVHFHASPTAFPSILWVPQYTSNKFLFWLSQSQYRLLANKEPWYSYVKYVNVNHYFILIQNPFKYKIKYSKFHNFYKKKTKVRKPKSVFGFAFVAYLLLCNLGYRPIVHFFQLTTMQIPFMFIIPHAPEQIHLVPLYFPYSITGQRYFIFIITLRKTLKWLVNQRLHCLLFYW